MPIIELMEVARIGALFLPGDSLEEVMPPERRAYPLRVQSGNEFALGDEIDYDEHHFNALKRVLLLTERIEPSRKPSTALWIRRPESPARVEVMVAGRSLPHEGYQIQPAWPELIRAFEGLPTRWDRPFGTTVYYPIRNSDEDIVGVLEVSESTSLFAI
ncbi:hypothetical protein GXP70_16270 [Paenibacillus lycopersici]|uniref:Uncharacterized protein n=1 Tax=Paenibacillus lycopersici TaxID=2704462 RepID=A0A6C0FW57_9BACL|nr:hypothetical protein [Paenibacillus lycopersici]QHT61358.1 hypothetical protein GXP70_16270 [Paenibacillus lycopersici]